MMRIGRLGAALAVTLVLGFGLSQAAVADITPNAQATAVEVHLVQPREMKYADGHLFVADLDTVVVLNLDGSVDRIISGMFGAGGMALSPDDSRLYVALSGGSKIAVIDTAKQSLVATWHVQGCPADVAVADSRLYYSFGCQVGDGTVSSLDATTGTDPRPTPIKNLYNPPLIASGGSTLAVSQGGSPDLITTYRVARAVLRPLSGPTDASLSAVGGMCVSADGRQVLGGSDGNDGIDAIDPRKLTPVATYPSDASPTDVALSHNGKYVAAGFASPDGVGLAVFNRHSGRAVVAANTSLSEVGVLPGTVDFSDDDSMLYALLGVPGGDGNVYLEHVSLSKTTGSTPTTLTLALSHDSGTALRAVARLTGVDKPARITFIVTDGGGTRTLHAMTGRYRDAAVTFSPAGNGNISAIYAGDRTHAPAKAEPQSFVAQDRIVSDMRLDLPDSITPGEKVAARAELYGVVGARVEFVVQSATGRRILRAVTGSSGTATVTFVARSAGSVTANFDGDAAYQPATARRTFDVGPAQSQLTGSSVAAAPTASAIAPSPVAQRARPTSSTISWGWALVAGVVLAAAALATGRMRRRGR